MNKANVLIILNYASIQQLHNPGGILHYVVDRIKKMEHDKIQCDILRLCKPRHKHRVDGWVEEELKPCGSKIFFIERPTFMDSFLSHPLIKILFPFRYKKNQQYIDLFKNYKVIHFHDTRHIHYLFNLAKEAGVTCRIVHAHKGASFVRNQLSRSIKRFFLGKIPATHFWGCSELASTHSYGAQLVKSGQTEFIKNGIDCEQFAFSEEKRKLIRLEFNIKKNDLLIGHIGRFDRQQKNQTFLIDVFNTFCTMYPEKNAKLLLIGDGETFEIIKNKAATLNLKNKVILAGKRKDTFAIYSALDCFVLPSIHEGLPIVGVEAQTAGLPCVFSDSISRKSKINDPLIFLSLKAPLSMWAETIYHITKIENNRKSAFNNVIQAGWNLSENAISLQNFYISQHVTPNHQLGLYNGK